MSPRELDPSLLLKVISLLLEVVELGDCSEIEVGADGTKL